jgi:hypothetical protein
MVKDELFTILYTTRRKVAVYVDEENDLENGTFTDEEDVERVHSVVSGRITQKKYLASEPVIRLALLPTAHIETGWRVKRNKTGTIYVVSDVTPTKLAGSDLIVELRE